MQSRQVQQGSGEGSREGSAEVFSALGFAARFRKICKNKMSRRFNRVPEKVPVGDTTEAYFKSNFRSLILLI